MGTTPPPGLWASLGMTCAKPVDDAAVVHRPPGGAVDNPPVIPTSSTPPVDGHTRRDQGEPALVHFSPAPTTSTPSIYPKDQR